MMKRKSEMERSLEGRICTPLLHYYDWRGLITSDTRAVWSFFGQAKKLGKNRGIRYGEDVESKMLDRGMFLVSCITILGLNTCCSFLNAKCAPIEPSGGCWIRFFGLHRLQEGAGQKREKFSLTASSGVLHNEVRHRQGHFSEVLDGRNGRGGRCPLIRHRFISIENIGICVLQLHMF
jgi:hypothetical protein